jgi:hydroxymethylbilane synthase
MVASLDGERMVGGEMAGPATEGEGLGAALAEDLLARGGRAILDALRAR